MNWDDYHIWQDTTTYARTIVVAGLHPQADDTNDGTAESPLKTINAAAQKAQPGDRVCIHRGHYRESIRPARGGLGTDQMISYEAAYGEEVIVSGSVILTTPWNRPAHWKHPDYDEGKRIPSWSQHVWVTPLAEAIQNHPDQACQHKNIHDYEYAIMDWAEPVRDHTPFSLKKALLFQDGQRLTQLSQADDLPRVPGSFFIDNGHSLLVHPFNTVNPNDACFELAVENQLFCPQAVGLNYVRVAGITFEHCSNAFIRAGAGAVSSSGGAYWLFENNTIRQCNSAGLEFGDNAFESKDPNPLNINRKRELKGFVIARNNHIHDCGTAGIRSLNVKEARVIGNYIHDCGWHEAEFYYECAGIKLLVNKHTLVANNRIEQMTGACGIWMDWSNQYARVTNNLIRDIHSLQGAIFIEASRVPNLIDRNVIWNVDGDGIFAGETEHQLYVHNLVANTTKAPMKIIRHSDRDCDGKPLLVGNNTVQNNLFINPQEHDIDTDPEKTSGPNDFTHNVYISTNGLPDFDWQAWQGSDYDADSIFIHADCELNYYLNRLHFRCRDSLPAYEAHPAVSRNWFGLEWDQACQVGPFGLSQECSFTL